jgi:lipopolysaccharide export system protein LptA|tara:strand:+ start:5 stop:592 length:588 start_codon:yes stop_codon:yes gene_type:complete
MKSNDKKIQISLIIFGSLLIFFTYFFYPKINEKKFLKDEINPVETLEITKDQVNVFENVTYEGFYNIINPFTIKSDDAYILNDEPEIIYMKEMNVTMYMNDGSIVNIRSDKGRYNKITYDCFFEDNVVASSEDAVVYSDNLDMLASEDLVRAYNNVLLTSEKNSLRADNVDYDFEKKLYQISMYNDKQVKIKIIE